MSDDERKFVHFHVQKVDFTSTSFSGMSQATCTLKGDVSSDIDWEVIVKRMQEGWEVSETGSLLHDALTVAQADLEKERLRYQDLQQKFDAFKTESNAVVADLGNAMTNMKTELQRLRKMEQDLEALSGLSVHKVVR